MGKRSEDGPRDDAPDALALERHLDDARARVRRAVEALRPKHRGGEVEECRAAVAAQPQAERALAVARGEPAAIALPWEPLGPRRTRASCPLLGSSNAAPLPSSRDSPCVGRLQRQDGRCHGRYAGDNRDGVLRGVLRLSLRRPERRGHPRSSPPWTRGSKRIRHTGSRTHRGSGKSGRPIAFMRNSGPSSGRAALITCCLSRRPLRVHRQELRSEGHAEHLQRSRGRRGGGALRALRNKVGGPAFGEAGPPRTRRGHANSSSTPSSASSPRSPW